MANPDLVPADHRGDRRRLGDRPQPAAQAAAAGRRRGLPAPLPPGQAGRQGALRRLAQGDDRAGRSIRTPSSTARSSASTSTSGSCSTSCTSSCFTTGCGRTPAWPCRRAPSSSPARRPRPISLAKLIIKLINNVGRVIDADPADPRAHQGRVPAELQRVAGRAADPGQRRVGADLDGRLRGQRHRQHEVHDERRPDRSAPATAPPSRWPRRPARRTSSCSA